MTIPRAHISKCWQNTSNDFLSIGLRSAWFKLNHYLLSGLLCFLVLLFDYKVDFPKPLG